MLQFVYSILTTLSMGPVKLEYNIDVIVVCFFFCVQNYIHNELSIKWLDFKQWGVVYNKLD